MKRDWHEKNKIMPFAATQMGLETVMLSEVSQAEKDRYVISLVCGIGKKMVKWTYLRRRNRFSDFKSKLMVTRREWRRKG